MKYCKAFFIVLFVILVFLFYVFTTAEVLSLKLKIDKLEQSVLDVPEKSNFHGTILRDEDLSGPSVEEEPCRRVSDGLLFDIQIDGIEGFESRGFKNFKVSVREGAPVEWTLRIDECERASYGYGHVEWMFAGKQKELFEWDALKRKLKFVGRKYLEGETNEYYLAIGAWDTVTYKSHEAVLAVKVKRNGT